MLGNSPLLLVTKLHVPRLRASQISRPHLFAALDAGLEHRLILVAAAAGFGKTTLLADWSSRRADNVCWLSLDERDNDPARFLSYLIAAIQTRHPHVASELLAALQSPQPPAVEYALHILLNQLAAVPDRVIVVLDDYHVIENRAVHEALAFLLEHLPRHMTLILLTRVDPPLPLARLRARNDLVELRAAALRFSIEEAGHFLNETFGLQLSPESIRALDTRTEGWIAGLQLAAVALGTLQGDKQAFVRDFSGSHRFVLDYLMEEVLSHQPEHVRRFLLRTSVLRRMNGALCSAVADEADGQRMLEYLEKNNLFLIPLDQSRYWYRYHHLFADLLQARLQAEYPAEVSVLQQRAAEWHEQNGLAEEAIDYALAAKDFDHAAQLITGPAVHVTRRGEVITLLDWYKSFPPDFISHHASLSLHFGLAFALNGRWDDAENLLSYVEQQEADSRPDEALLLAYLVASYRHDAARLARIAEQAAATRRADPVTKLVLALVISLKGDFQQACDLLAEAQAASARAGDHSLSLSALFHQCRFHVFLGNLHQAYELSQQALQQVHDLSGAALPMASFAHVSLGRILIEWNELDEAAHHLLEVIRLSELTGFLTGNMSSATMMLAEVKQAQGDIEGANQAAETALAHAERYDPPPEVGWLKIYQVRLWLVQGNTAAAANWLRTIEGQQQPMSMFYPTAIQQVTRARVLLTRRKTEEAVALLNKLAAEPRCLLSVEALAVLALARQSQGDSIHALLTLEQALTLAESERRIRVFLDLGAPMGKLLARFVESNPRHSFAQHLLSAFSQMPALSSLVDPLSERELEVLRLIAAGHSNEEIARTLTLALSTVKWYINILYGKLHVETRSQAIARAHELRLLL